MEPHDHTHESCCGHDHAAPGDHHHHHDHDHVHEDETYFIDQLCMVGLSGAFGVICLCLYLWKQQMLFRLLGTQFHLFILGSGIALVLLALLRGITLWFQAGAQGAAHAHHHHHHDHDNAHGAISPELSPTEHGHHHHHHDHSHEDHDHGWAPWRYVVLLVPVILFLLGLPDKGPEAKDKDIAIDFTQESASYARLIVAGPGLPMLAQFSVLSHEGSDGDVQPADFKQLEGAALSADRRELWKNKTIEIRGQYSPSTSSDRVFRLVRYRIGCCAADAVELEVPVVCKEPVKIARNQWVKVTGKVDFMERNGNYTAVVMAPKAAKVQKCMEDLNPYLR